MRKFKLYDPINSMILIILFLTAFAYATPASAIVPPQLEQQIQSADAGKPPPNTVITTTGGLTISDKTSPINFSQYDSIVLTMERAGTTMAERFVPDAEKLASILGGIGFTWLGIMIILSQADVWHMGLRPIFILAIYYGITLAMLEFYPAFSADVINGFFYAASTLTQTNALNGYSVAGQMYSNFGSVVTALWYSLNPHLLPVTSSWTALPDDVVELFSTGTRFVMDVLELVPWAFVMMISALLFCVLFITFQIGIAVAIAVGPVFIPFLVLPITRFLFEGWLKFLIMAGIYYLAAVVVASLIGVGMLAFAQDTQNLDAAMKGVSSISTIQHGFVINMGIIAQLGIFDLVGLLAMLMVPSFAHAMAGSVNLSGLDMGAKGASMATKGMTKAISKK